MDEERTGPILPPCCKTNIKIFLPSYSIRFKFEVILILLES